MRRSRRSTTGSGWLASPPICSRASAWAACYCAAIGLAITFGVMGVINMAHGEMIMLGAYTAYVCQQLFRT